MLNTRVEFRQPLVLLTICLCALFSAHKAFAQIPPQQDQLSAELIGLGHYELARQVLSDSQATQADFDLLDGRILKARGDNSGAVVLFRKAIAANPNHLFARRELAHSLFLLQKYQASRAQLIWLLRNDASPSLRQGYVNLLQQIERTRPLKFGVNLAFEPSSNINSGSSARYLVTSLGTLEIDPNSQQKSGIGATLGFSLRWRPEALAEKGLSFGTKVSRTLYPDHPELNQTIGEISLSYERRTQTTQLQLTPYVARNWTANQNDLHKTGLSVSWSSVSPKGHRQTYTVISEKRKGLDASTKTGPYHAVSAKFDRKLSAQMSASLRVTGDRSQPQARHQAYDGLHIEASLHHRWQKGLSGGVSLFAGARQFHGVFPLSSEARSDEFRGIEIRLSHQSIRLGNFIPQLSCRAQTTRSNVALYDSNSQSCTLAVQQEF